MTDIVKGGLHPENFCYKWKVERFFGGCKNVGDSYTSPTFSVQHPDKITNWYIRVYPKGLNEKNKEFVIVYLNFSAENTTEVTVDYEIFFAGKTKHLLTTGKFTTTFKGPSVGWRSNLIKESIVKDLNNGVVIDDTLSIFCEMKFHPIAQDHPEYFYHEWLTKIGNGLGNYVELFESGSFSDVTFNVQDQKIQSHKAILSCRSQVFKSMFKHDMKDKQQNSVDITDIDYTVMIEVFRFIYSGKVENIEKIASELLIAADKYAVIELKALCEMTLYDNLTIENAVEYLQLTDTCDTIHLKTLVIKFAAINYKDVIKKPEFANLNSNVMHQILLVLAEKDC